MLRIRVKTGSTYVEVQGKKLVLAVGNENKNTTLYPDKPKNAIRFTDTRESAEEWYSAWLTGKQLAMNSGGSLTTGPENMRYSFTVGIGAYIYNGGDTPYLKTIQSTAPDSSGNIQILPGKTVDVTLAPNGVAISKIKTGILKDAGTVYREINIFLWYLYHAANYQMYRMRMFSPSSVGSPMFRESHMLGTIPSYQALVARWNYLVWLKSFLVNVSQADETLSFNVGYCGDSCTPTTVNIRVTLTLTQAADTEGTIKFFTMYSQGITTSLTPASSGGSGGYSVQITKYQNTDGTGAHVDVPGKGTDDWAGVSEWGSIVIDITNLVLSQGDYYNQAFSLAVALNEKTTYYYQSLGSASHKFNMDVVWTVGNQSYAKHYNNLSVLTIILHEEGSDAL